MCHNLGISSVNNLDLNFINNLSITWSPPSFYSDDIPQESITTYYVIVKSQDVLQHIMLLFRIEMALY